MCQAASYLGPITASILLMVRVRIMGRDSLPLSNLPNMRSWIRIRVWGGIFPVPRREAAARRAAADQSTSFE